MKGLLNFYVIRLPQPLFPCLTDLKSFPLKEFFITRLFFGSRNDQRHDEWALNALKTMGKTKNHNSY